MTSCRFMQTSQETIGHPQWMTGIDRQARVTVARFDEPASLCGRFQGSDNGRTNGYHTATSLVSVSYFLRGFFTNEVFFFGSGMFPIQLVVHVGAQSCMQSEICDPDSMALQMKKRFPGECSPCARHLRRPGFRRIHVLVTVDVPRGCSVLVTNWLTQAIDEVE